MFATIERFGRALLLAMPTLLALVFYPNLEAPFTDAKTALFFFVTAVVLALWLAVARRTYPGRPLVSGIHLAALGLVGASVLSYAFSPWRYLGLLGVLWSLTGILLFWAMRQLLFGCARSVLCSIAIAGATSAIIAVVQRVWSLDLFTLFGSVSEAPGRMAVHGTLGNPDWLAAFLALTLPAVSYCALSSAKLALRIAWTVLTLLSLAMIIVTGSRAGMLAASLALLITLWLRGGRVLKLTGVAAAMAVIALAVFAPQALNRRSVGTAFHGRAVIWKTALSQPAPHLVIGSGPSTFAYLYPLRMGAYFSRQPEDVRFASYERHAQNDFVETFAEAGLLGLAMVLALLIFWGMLAYRARQSSPAEALASLAALVALIALACFDFPLHRAETWFLVWMWLTLPVLTLDENRNLSPRAGWKTLMPATVILVLFVYAGALPLIASHRLATAQQQESLGDLARAESCLRAALRVWPNATAQFDLVRILAKQERYADALDQSLRAEPWMSEPELFLLRARILRAMGREEEARRTAQESATRFPYSQLLADELASFPQNDAGRVVPH